MTITAPPSAAQLRFGAYTFPPLLASRLVAEQGWTVARTAEVLAEYRRFLHLAAFSGQSVTPSLLVDEAWHEHLTLTRDYWERLCGEVLGQPIHHDSAEGGTGDASAYMHTLDLYARTFGETPPPRIWPDPRLIAPVLSAPARRLVGSVPLRFLIFAGLLLAGGLLWHGAGIFVGFLLGLAVLLSGVKWQPARARSGTGGGDDSTGWMFGALSLGDSGSDSSPGCSDGGGGSDGDGSSCGSGCGSS